MTRFFESIVYQNLMWLPVWQMKIDYVLLSHDPATRRRSYFARNCREFPMQKFSADRKGNILTVETVERSASADGFTFQTTGDRKSFRSRAALFLRGRFDNEARLGAVFFKTLSTIYFVGDSCFAHYKQRGSFSDIDYFYRHRLIQPRGLWKRIIIPRRSFAGVYDSKAKF